MRDLKQIIKEMRQAPPTKSDDPRFDELEDLASDLHGEEAEEGEADPFTGLGDEDEDMTAPAAKAAPEDGIPSDDEDAAIMNEALGKEDLGSGTAEAPEEEETPEEEIFGKKKRGGVEPKAKRRNPLMKKSSYLDM